MLVLILVVLLILGFTFGAMYFKKKKARQAKFFYNSLMKNKNIVVYDDNEYEKIKIPERSETRKELRERTKQEKKVEKEERKKNRGKKIRKVKVEDVQNKEEKFDVVGLISGPDDVELSDEVGFKKKKKKDPFKKKKKLNGG